MARLPMANILAHKVRTAISMLAVAVGVAMFLVLAGLTDMVREVADRTINVDAGMMVWPASDQVLLSGGMPAETVERRLIAIPEVVQAVPVLRWPINLAGRVQNVYGIRPEDWPRFGRGEERIIEGRRLENGDEMVIDSRLARAGNLSVGQTVERFGRRFRIVGIAREGVAGRVFMPIETVSRCTQQDRLRASFFYLVLRSPADVPAARDAVDRLGLRAITFDEYYTMLAASFIDMNVLTAGILFVAGFVCFLVILLTMYTMVLERTRQIGILKGIGASRLQVFGLIMAEAGLLCAGGIVLGFLLTSGSRAAILRLQPLWTVTVPAHRFVYAAALATGGTLLGAIHPAMRAAGRDPVESLRYE